jgi:diguanylate cyclase (GGDEF)-like protein
MPGEWMQYREEDAADGFPDASGKTAFNRDVAQAISETADRPLAVLMADLDHFKNINDRVGHRCADLVLTEVIRNLRSAVGMRGKAYRWGGEELLAILPNSSESEAADLAERFRDGIERTPFPGLASGEVTISIGVAQLLKSETAERLFDRANRSAKAAKTMGRNRVYLASGRALTGGPPKPRFRNTKLVYALAREDFIRGTLENFASMYDYEARGFKDTLAMLNSTDAPDALIVELPLVGDMSNAEPVRAAKAKWPTVQVVAIVEGPDMRKPVDEVAITDGAAAGVAFFECRPFKIEIVFGRVAQLIGPGKV